MKTSRGFTLIELLVVISILALLISLLLPSLKEARKASIRLLCLTRIRQAGYFTILYTKDYKDWLPKPHASTLYSQFNYGALPPGTEPYAEAAAAQIMAYGNMGVWTPPPTPESRLTDDEYQSWMFYDCPNSPDRPQWGNWNVVWYYVRTEFSPYFGWTESPYAVPGSAKKLKRLNPHFPLWADNSWTIWNDLNFINASWHEYAGNQGGVDLFIGLNTARADGSADWVPGRTNRSENFVLGPSFPTGNPPPNQFQNPVVPKY